VTTGGAIAFVGLAIGALMHFFMALFERDNVSACRNALLAIAGLGFAACILLGRIVFLLGETP
jgi:hypothetical protein